MKRLLIVAATTGYQTRAFADAARRLDLVPVLATDRCHILDDPWGDQAIAIRFGEVADAAEKIAADGPFDGIVAVGDRAAVVAARAAELLGLAFHPLAAVEACRDKHLSRTLLAKADLLVPAHFRVPLSDSPEQAAYWAKYPCVLKPLGLSASRGVIRADNKAEFIAAFERIRKLLADPRIQIFQEDQSRYLQVETFIPGREFALEGLVTGGELEVLAIFDKPDPLDGPYFEETIYVTPSREDSEVQVAIEETARAAVRALGLRHGPIHAEMRVNQDGVWMLEVAARPIGGLCGKVLRFEGDLTLEELIVCHAIGSPIPSPTLMDAASGVMMIPIPHGGTYNGVRGEEFARDVRGVHELIITAKVGQILEPLPEGASYLGFIFAHGVFAEQVDHALREAHKRLEFQIATTLAVVE